MLRRCTCDGARAVATVSKPTQMRFGKAEMGSALMGSLQICHAFWQRDFLGTPVNLLYLPKSARAYLFPQSVKIPYFRSGPISVDPICPQPTHASHRVNGCEVLQMLRALLWYSITYYKILYHNRSWHVILSYNMLCNNLPDSARLRACSGLTVVQKRAPREARIPCGPRGFMFQTPRYTH